MAPLSRSTRAERADHILDVAAELFYARGVHEVGMDELIRATGLGKATVYRLFPSKEALIASYLTRAAARIFAEIDDEVARHATDPAAAVTAIFAAIATDIARPGFRGCAFNNASIEFADPEHPARVVARDYRRGLHLRLQDLVGSALADQLAIIIDGMYTSGAHLGPDGPARSGPRLAARLVAG